MTDRRQASRRGRPVEWRKPGALRRSIMLRLTEISLQGLQKLAKSQRSSVSEVLRGLIEQAVVDSHTHQSRQRRRSRQRRKKLTSRGATKRVDAGRAPNGNVVVHTRAGIEARADAVARDLGVDRKAAFKRLDRGQLRGTVAEMQLAPLRFLLD